MDNHKKQESEVKITYERKIFFHIPNIVPGIEWHTGVVKYQGAVDFWP